MSARLTHRLTLGGFALFAVLLAVVPLMAANEYSLRLFMLFMIYAIVALGLNILIGLTGLLSLGQAGLFALGAYTGAILSTRLHFDLLFCSIAGAVVAGLFGALLAYPTVRVKGVYLAVITIAFGLIVENAAIEWHGLTGGTTGISGIPKPSVFGIPMNGFRYYGVLAVIPVRRHHRHAQHQAIEIWPRHARGVAERDGGPQRRPQRDGDPHAGLRHRRLDRRPCRRALRIPQFIHLARLHSPSAIPSASF